MGIVLNYCQYGVLYLGSYYNTGPYINFPHFENSNLGKLPPESLSHKIPKVEGNFPSCPLIKPCNKACLETYVYSMGKSSY